MGPKYASMCARCYTLESEKWHTVDRGVVLCTVCLEKQEREQRELEAELKEIQAAASLVKLEPEASSDSTPAPVVSEEVVTEPSDNKEEPSDTKDEPSEEVKPELPLDEVKEETVEAKEEKGPEVDVKEANVEVKEANVDEEVKEINVESSKETKEEVTEKPAPSVSPRKLRKNVRNARKGGAGGSGAGGTKGGRSRRSIFKKNPMKTPNITVSTRTVESLFHNQIYFQIGDIVSMMDAKDNKYYAQIRGLVIDSYCEKSACITWLLPTTSSPPPNERFDPATYIIGPEEDIMRKLSCMEFVMHAPSNYYYDRNNPYPRPASMGPENTTQRDNSNYIWANIAHLH